MKEYRCTRNQPYLDPKCFGFADMAARQGYYLKAESEIQALAQMAQLFPNEVSVGFTAQEWKIDCPICRGQGKVTPRSLCSNGLVLLHSPIICELCQGAGEVEVSEAEAYYDDFS